MISKYGKDKFWANLFFCTKLIWFHQFIAVLRLKRHGSIWGLLVSRNVRAERVKFGTETEFGREKEPLIRHSGRRWRGMTFHQQHVALCKSYNSSLCPLLHHTLLLSSLTTPTRDWVYWTTENNAHHGFNDQKWMNLRSLEQASPSFDMLRAPVRARWCHRTRIMYLIKHNACMMLP